jgi:hypothetical protein
MDSTIIYCLHENEVKRVQQMIDKYFPLIPGQPPRYTVKLNKPALI